MAYPALLFYEKEAHIQEGENYQGENSLFEMQEFVLSKITVNIQNVDQEVWDYGFDKQQWLLFLCPHEEGSCPEPVTRLKVAAAIEGIMKVGLVTDPDLCNKIYATHKENPIVFWKVNDQKLGHKEATEVRSITGSDTKEIVDKLLDLLPDPKTLDEETFGVM